MELRTALTRRRMTRALSDDPLPRPLLDELLDLARRAPSAGNVQATGFVVLEGPAEVARYWDVTLPGGDRRDRFRWPGLLHAPALVIITVDPGAYLDRYREPDKAATGRGAGPERWPVPYWWVDAGAVAQNLLLLCTEAGLGACLFGPFDHEPALRHALGVPDRLRLVATVAIGHPAGGESGGAPGRSAGRPRPPLSEIVLRPRPRPNS